MLALFLSPHLDDVAFSCGGLVYNLSQVGWQTVVATLFTRSVPHPSGFALTCQTDKGIPAEIDYLALRREEDAEAMRYLKAKPQWLDLPEAPHRGYHSPASLFADIRQDDHCVGEITIRLAALIREYSPALILAPQGLGGHVDHRQLIRALNQLAPPMPIAWYRDTPYAIRQPNAAPAPEFPNGLVEWSANIAASIDAKIAACIAYRSQLTFQFGGIDCAASVLQSFAEAEGHGTGPAERFLIDRQHLAQLRQWFSKAFS